MVSRARLWNDDRAQLVLVGAIAIGIVLIALTTVLNSAVFTENVAGGRSVEVTGDVTEFDREAVRNVRSMTVRINHAKDYKEGSSGEDELEEHAAKNVSNYSAVLAESYADTGSVYVNVSYDQVSEFGYRVVQREDANFSKNTGTPTWEPIGGPFELSWFVVNLEVENVSQTTPFYVNLTNSSGTDLNVSIRRLPGNVIWINSSIDGTLRAQALCEADNGRVLLDVADGTSYSGDCEFNGTEEIDSPYSTLEFVNGESVRGKYDFVANDSSTNTIPNSCGAGNSPVRPCEGTVIWSLEFTSRYRTGSFAYEKTHNVSVYDE